MASEEQPQVNDEDVAKMSLSFYSQLMDNYAEYLRGIVATFDAGWQEGLRPQLNQLIHAMEKEAEVL